MHLVDTSVWSDDIRGQDDAHVLFLRDLLSNSLTVSIAPLTFLEILRGARDSAAFERLLDHFNDQRFVDFEQPVNSHAAAAHIYSGCRLRG